MPKNVNNFSFFKSVSNFMITNKFFTYSLFVIGASIITLSADTNFSKNALAKISNIPEKVSILGDDIIATISDGNNSSDSASVIDAIKKFFGFGDEIIPVQVTEEEINNNEVSNTTLDIPDVKVYSKNVNEDNNSGSNSSSEISTPSSEPKQIIQNIYNSYPQTLIRETINNNFVPKEDFEGQVETVYNSVTTSIDNTISGISNSNFEFLEDLYVLGNIGIGITTPSSRLNIYDADGGDLLKIEGSANTIPIGLKFATHSGDTGAIRSMYTDPSSNTATELQFYTNGVGGNSNLVQRMVIDGNGYVGIGTTSPTSKLTVNGQVHVNDAILIENSSPANTGNKLYANASNLYWSGNLISGASAGNWTTDGTHAWRATGNVGVGTSSPWAQLSINPNGILGPAFAIGSSTATHFIVTNVGGVGIGTTTPQASGLHISNSGGDKLFLDSTDNSNAADIRYQYLGTNRWILRRTTDSGSDIGSDFQFLSRNNDGSALATVLTMKRATSNVGISSTTPFARLSVKGGGTTTGVNFQTTNSSDTPLFTILDNGNVGIGTSSPGFPLSIVASTYPVQVNTRTTSETSVGRTALALKHKTSGTMADGFGSLLEFWSEDDSGVENRIASVGSARQGADNAASLIFETHNGTTITERMRLDKDGNLGIGTTSPDSLLQLYAATAGTSTLKVERAMTSGQGESRIHLRNLFHDVYTKLYSPDGGNTSLFGIEKGTSDPVDFYLDATDNSVKNQLYISRGGNVGIGTTSPAARLHVNTYNGTLPSINSETVAVFSRTGLSTAGVQLSIITGNNGSGQLFFGDTDSEGQGRVLYDNTSDYMSLYTAGSEKFRINSSGNVGIGTTSPTSSLTIRGATDDYANIFVKGAGTRGVPQVILDRGSDGRDQAGVQMKTNGTFNWFAGIPYNAGAATSEYIIGNSTDLSGAKLLINSSGNVGIGSTTPWAQLSINPNGISGPAFAVGSSTATSLLVTNGGWVGIGTTSPVAKLAVNNSSGPGLFVNAESGNGIYSSTSGSSGWGGEFHNRDGGGDRSVTLASRSYAAIFSNGSVGIGSSSPASLLSLATSTGDGIFSQTAGSSAWAGKFYNADGGAGSISEVLLGGATYSALFNNGNVGIGTNNPSVSLAVKSPDAAVGSDNDGFRLQSSSVINTGTKILSFGTADTADYAWIRAYDHGVGESNLAIQPSGGNVGIGTTTPADKLHIHGGDLRIGSSNSATDQITNNINFVNSYVTANPLAAISVRTGSAVANSNLVFQTSNVGTMTEKMRLTGEGNLGIGTSTPISKLTITGQTSEPSLAATSTALFDIGSLNGSNPSSRLVFTSSATYPFTTSIQNRHAVLYGESYPIALNPLGGNVGIGTTSPLTSGLEIVRSGYAENSAQLKLWTNSTDVGGNGANYIQLQRNGGDTYTLTPTANNMNLGRIEFFGVASNSSIIRGATISASQNGSAGLNGVPTDITFSTSDGTNAAASRMLISNNGNVGIGSTTPWAQLSINPNGVSGPAFAIGSSTATRMIVTNAGNVGIGTTSPAYRLDVSGDIRSSTGLISGGFDFVLGNTDQSSRGNSGASRAMVKVSGNILNINYDGDFSGGTQVANNIFLANTGSSYFNAGNVGIGTTTPVSTLSVQGSLCVRNTGSCGTTAGTIYATTAAVTDIDLAENYPTNDSSLSAGEIVMFDKGANKTAYIKRADRSEGGTIMGIISTAPGLLLGRNLPDITRPVALSGRVPLKVNSENGSIAMGDRISLSSVPGVGMKASLSGETVAIALEPFDANDGNGTIEVFVNLRNNIDLSPIELVKKDISDLNVRVDILASSTISQAKTEADNAVASFFNSIKEWTLEKITVVKGYFTEIFADKVNTKELCIEDVCVTKTQLQSLLNSASSTQSQITTQSSPSPAVTPSATPSPSPIISSGITSTENTSTSTTTSSSTTSTESSTSTSTSTPETITETSTSTSTPETVTDTSSTPASEPVVSTESTAPVESTTPVENTTPIENTSTESTSTDAPVSVEINNTVTE